MNGKAGVEAALRVVLVLLVLVRKLRSRRRISLLCVGMTPSMIIIILIAGGMSAAAQRGPKDVQHVYPARAWDVLWQCCGVVLGGCARNIPVAIAEVSVKQHQTLVPLRRPLDPYPAYA